MTISADGDRVVSQAGTALLRELTEDTGLVAGWIEALLDTPTYKTVPMLHPPGRGAGRSGGDDRRWWGRAGAPGHPAGSGRAVRAGGLGGDPRGGPSTASTPGV